MSSLSNRSVVMWVDPSSWAQKNFLETIQVPPVCELNFLRLEYSVVCGTSYRVLYVNIYYGSLLSSDLSPTLVG